MKVFSRGTRRALAVGLVVATWMPVVASAAVPLDEDGGPTLTAEAVLVLDTKTGKPLLARRASEVRSIASLTKLMAALVFINRGLKLDEGTVVNRDDWKVALDGCRTRLELKWTYSNRDLLHAALMSSDNRAVSALGRAVGLHANALVQAMNEQARKMGLRKTQFRGPVGIEPENVSTAWEMSRIVRAASHNKVLREIMGKKEHRVVPMRGYLKRWYRNTNPLVGSTKDTTFLASKTGYNQKAGYCVATVVELPRRGVVTVVLLGSKRKADRVRDLRRVLRWLRAGGQQKSS
jgi:D-alanyl-D-alanine endopeptidase (penicillin-binding protein 7)